MDYPGKVITKNQVIPSQTSASGNWTLDDAATATKSNTWPVAGVPNPISRSLRFNSADSAYLSRTFGAPTNQNVWSLSMWLKKTSIGAYGALFARSDEATLLEFLTDDTFVGYMNASNIGATSSVYRDPSSWYHFLFVCSASTAQTLYVNGTQVKTYTATNRFNASGVTHLIGARNGPSEYINGYMTEINFIDGQALTPSSFGLTDPSTGVWIPQKYTGTYGTNGFYLNFKDNTSTTTIGYDYSGNGNNWTTNNFSVTAGAGNDSLTDVPTPWIAYNTTGDVGGVVRGNYCTLNPLDKNSTQVPKDGNLLFDGSVATGGLDVIAGTMRVVSGKWYWESTITAVGSVAVANVGITKIQCVGRSTSGSLGSVSGECAYLPSGNKQVDGSSTAYGSSYTTGDVIGVALDCDAGTVTFYKNNVSQGSISYAVGNGLAPALGQVQGYGAIQNINFGQRPFAYTPPAGYLSLCTTNLPAPTIGATSTTQANKYFDATIYTGNGGTQSIVNSGSMQPDLVWVKGRSVAYNNYLEDSVRGVGKDLSSNLTDAEATYSLLSSFNSNGFTVYTNGTYLASNQNGTTYVGWQWRASNTTAVTNTSGTITSTVSANTTSGFSVVTYTGNGTNGATVGHGLGVAPKMVIVKNRDGTRNWMVYHSSLSASNNLYLNSTSAQFALSTTSDGGVGGVSSTTFTCSQGSINTNATNENTKLFVAYCFSDVAGYSAFGSYTGNGSTDGPFVYLGFRPRYVLVKAAISDTSEWVIHDTSRDPYNVASTTLAPSSSSSESTFGASYQFDILSNGFKIRTSSTPNNNAATYIYAAFAESPFKFANAR